MAFSHLSRFIIRKIYQVGSFGSECKFANNQPAPQPAFCLAELAFNRIAFRLTLINHMRGINPLFSS